MISAELQEDQNSQDIRLTNPESKAAVNPKRQFPPFWQTLKHPSSSSVPPKFATDPLELFTEQQKATYKYVLNALNSPEFELPTSSSNNDSTSKSHQPKSHTDSQKLSDVEKCYCSHEFLVRVCRATGWDSNRALKRIIEILLWRRDYQVDQIDYQTLWKAAEPGVEFTLGYDNRQRPLLYMFPSKQTTKPSSVQIKLLVWYLERTIDLMPPGVETLTLVIDFGSSPKNSNSIGQPAPISTAKEVLRILQTYYCERLGLAICVNVPWLFWGFFKVLKPFLDPKTTQKILFDPVVTEHVPAEQLLKESFGGDLDFRYDHKTYFPLLAELTAHRRQRALARYKRLAKGMVGMSEFQLRGGHRRSKRDQSIGTATTATSISPRGTRPSSPSVAVLGQQRDPKLAEDSARLPAAIAFQSSPKPRLQSNEIGQQLVPAQSTSAFTPQANVVWKNPRRSAHFSVDQSPLVQVTGPIVASRPFSTYSFSSPFDSPPVDERKPSPKKVIQEDKKKFRASRLFHPHSKSSNSNQLEIGLNPSSATPPVSPKAAGKRSSRRPLSFHSVSDDQHNNFGYRNFIDSIRDQNGRVQTDAMSSSRRINEVTV